MSSAWVVNASPVIALAKVGQLQLLEALGSPVLLPDAVAAEILAGPMDDRARATVAENWGQRCSPARVPETVVEWGLGAGESAVLAICLERSPATAVLDDMAARGAARALGIPVMGTMGVVMRAKRLGLLPSVAPVIAKLRKAGLYLNDAIVKELLCRSGEEPEG